MGVTCVVCDKTFSNRSNLNKHRKKAHSLKPEIATFDQSKYMYKCLEKNCNTSFRHNVGLKNHLINDHKKQIEYEDMEFSNKEDFLSWKEITQKTSKSSYVLSSSSNSEKNPTKYYLCNRSGKAQTRSSNKRLPRSQGSCKLNRNCISMIKVIEKEKLSVTWIKTHYGHAIDLQHLRLPQMDKSIVASKLTMGVPPSRILDSYRDKINEENLSREDLITRKDIQNIKTAYHINIAEGVKHENDAVSVNLWVKQCKDEENSNCILYYKEQGMEVEADLCMYNLGSTDFCLIIMTDFQRKMINKFGNNIVAIDGTHGLNNYDFELTTIMVVDEFGEGVPVSFMFSNRKDTRIYEIFFHVIKSSIGVVSPKVFMTDIVLTFYSAWCSIMGPVQQQLFCSWHIDRAWQQNLSKISNKDKRSEVYKFIKFLQQSTGVDEFVECLQKTIFQILQDDETHDFGVYFQNNYASNYQKWAYCFRAHCGINTNMRLESMHKVIKYFYLDGKKVKRLDKSLHVLLKYIRDKSVDRIIKNIKGKHTIHTKNILLRHRTALSENFSMDIDNINKKIYLISTLSDNKESGEIYCIEKHKNESCCALMCEICKICYHTYSCTCSDFSITNSICKHIHYIAMNCAQENELPDSEKLVTDNSMWNASTIEQNDKPENLRENFSAQILQTFNKLENNKHDLDDEIILQIQRHLNLIDKLIDLPINSTESFVAGPSNEPVNKNIEHQKRFFSTQKKKKTTKTKCKKPTPTETVHIRSEVKNNFTHLFLSSNASEDHNYL